MKRKETSQGIIQIPEFFNFFFFFLELRKNHNKQIYRVKYMHAFLEFLSSVLIRSDKGETVSTRDPRSRNWRRQRLPSGRIGANISPRSYTLP